LDTGVAMIKGIFPMRQYQVTQGIVFLLLLLLSISIFLPLLVSILVFTFEDYDWGPSEALIRKEFYTQKPPSCKITYLTPGEGNSAAVDYHIHYHCGDGVMHEDVWVYLWSYEYERWELLNQYIDYNVDVLPGE